MSSTAFCCWVLAALALDGAPPQDAPGPLNAQDAPGPLNATAPNTGVASGTAAALSTSGTSAAATATAPAATASASVPTTAALAASAPTLSTPDATCQGSVTGTSNIYALAEMMQMFPPIGEPRDTPIDVYINPVLLRIDHISPAENRWGVRMQTDMYWDAGVCALTPRNAEVCGGRYGTFYFVTPENIYNPDGETTNAAFEGSKQFSGNYANGGCLNGDYLDLSLIFRYNFKPEIYPYEVYMLDVKLSAFVTTQAVRLNVIDPTPDATRFELDMPHGWTSHSGLRCRNTTVRQAFTGRGGGTGAALYNAQVVCTVVVSNIADSWFLTVFIFWAVTMAANLLVGLGVFALANTELTLIDSLVSRGQFSSGAVLAFVFVVPVKPYGLPLTSGTVPTSSAIFAIGLITLTATAFYSFFLAKALTVLLRDQAHSSWWRALVDHADCIHDAVGDASRKVSSIMPSPPDAPPDRQAVPEATTRDGADERQQRQYRLRHRVGLFDTVLWIMVHSVTLVLAAVYLAQAKERQGSMIRMYVDAANAAVPPS